ncbi:transmembrane protein 214-B-like, partial [Saccoglossus kowalevskii]|uniref:Transmembrane protein 214-B-like n=1 Tax=Saccoglossus kowalevskii TaxID=10224 RepID=A0ABM0GLM6_SACKO
MASSTQWETVTHKKKATIADKKAARKALAENRPTIDELPTIGQSSTMFEAFEKGKKSKPKTQNNVTPSKQAKSNKKTVSKKNTKKDGGYKTLEEALKTLDVNEMKSLFTEVQNKFPNNSSLWVKDLVTFMNLKLNVKESDPVFTDQPIDYPLSKVGNGIRNVMISSLKKCSPATIQLFYEFCIQEMISDRKKNLPSYGYRIYLQCIAREYPHVPISNIPKYSDMISKKQNGPASCLSVMWSLGQAGYRNFETGLKIWLELMFPHLSTKALTNFVVLYLGNLFKNRKDKSAGYRVIGPNEFFPIMDFIFTPHNGLSSNLQKKLLEYYPKLK